MTSVAEQSRIAELEARLNSLRGMLREAIETKASVERALAAQQAKYEDLAQRVPWVLLRVRPDGHYADVNRYFANLIGRDVKAIVDRAVGSLDEPDEWVKFILEDQNEQDETFVTFAVNGVPRRFLSLKFRYRRNGYVSVLAVDETERAEALIEARRQAARADEANRAKSHFLAVMSHEIRTPMNGVLGLASLLDETELSPQQKEWTQTIRSSGESLIGLINNVLDMTKIESGAIELEYAPLSLHGLLDGVVELFRASAASKGVEIVACKDTSLPTEVLGDELRLHQILTNLVGNALKFTSEGQIRVHGRARLEGERWRVTFEVEDTGIGIEAAVIEKLFDAFTQADSSTTRRFGGSGLGLNIVKGLSQAMGGEIDVQSVVGQGSRFLVCVPLDRVTESSLVRPNRFAEEQDAIPLAGLRVLVAEDNAVNQRVAQAMLERLGCEVVIAENGQRAIDRLEADAPFDIVLMDVDMPVMDGVSATRAIRSGEGGDPAVPVVALTANAMMTDRTLCFDAGMTDFISKPVTKRALRRTLVEHARSDRSAG